MGKFLIVGASSAIGQEVVEQLKSLGHVVVTTARTTEKISPDYLLDACDFNAVEQVFTEHPDLSGVVNCAGSLLLKPAHLTSFEEWQDTINASLTSAFSVVRAAGKSMKDGGSVVLLGSAAAEIGLANHEAIAAAKAGICGLALSAAATYATSNLRFNVVEPGLTETPLSAAITNSSVMKQASVAMHPLGRLGKADEIARAIVFFLLPENSWISGQRLAVDGGLSRIKSRVKI